MINMNHPSNKTLYDKIMPDKGLRFIKPGTAAGTFIIVAFLFFASLQTGFAQRFAYVDSEYILNNIPAYRSAQEQLDKLAEEWQTEVELIYQEVEALYRSYQNERVLMSEEMRKKREDEIVSKEAEAADLQRKYFGPEGELYQTQEELIRPVQDRVYNAIEQMAVDGNYAVIFDTSDSPIMLYTDPRNDLSDDVLKRLGYTN